MKTYKEKYTTDTDMDFVEEYEKVVGETSIPSKELMQGKSDNKRFNGWANRDTWLVALWINCMPNYEWVKRNAHKLLKMNKNQLLTALNTVNWSKVNVTEIKRAIKENIE